MPLRSPYTVEIRLPAGEVRRWQAHVVATLAAEPGVAVAVVPVEAPPPPAGLDLLFAFERLFVGRDAETAADRVDLGAPPAAAGTPDLVVDLAGGVVADPAVPVLRPTCRRVRPLDGALIALFDGAVPVLAADLDVAGRARPFARWPVAIEDRRNGLRAVSMVLGRLADLILAAVRALRRAADPATAGLHLADDLRAPAGTPVGAATVSALFLRSLAERIRGRLTRLAGGERVDWRVIWRFRDSATPALAPERDPTPFRLLPDDGRRFFADPFPWDDGDRTLLFVEELPYDTGRGRIALVEIDRAGRVSPSRPVLEQDCHLSYPNVFAHDGRMWMIPETSGRGTVELWRADAFPDRWSLHAVLIDGVDLADVTLIERDDGWWMFAAARPKWCSSWDSLVLYHAPALEGPWTPHPADPAVVDVRSARPAGRMIPTPAGWLRPVQDSAAGYGAGLALARIDRLDPERYAETVVGRFHTPAPLRGLHTWNRSEGGGRLFETMDVFADAAAFGAERRLDLAPRTAVVTASEPT